MNSRAFKLISFWLLSSLLLVEVLMHFSLQKIEREIEGQLYPHLQASYDESLFSEKSSLTGSGRINDRRSIKYIGQQVNQVLDESVAGAWYSPVKLLRLSLQSVDGVEVDGVLSAEHQTSFSIARNQMSRPVVIAYQYEWNHLVFILLPLLLGITLLVFFYALPAPLSAQHRKWIYYLSNRDYSDDEAYFSIKNRSPESLELNEQQWALFHQLHNPADKNFTHAFDTVTDNRLLRFSDLQMQWFLKALSDGGDIAKAWGEALAPDIVKIDLIEGLLLIHNKNIPISKTPLFYYAWYALQCLSGDGWVLNPQSNKPDLAHGKELADLMWKYKGHAKAIGDLEETGLKAKTLDQNRSKIKEELRDALGDNLSEYYLFETKKEEHRTSYRLKLLAQQIEIIS